MRAGFLIVGSIVSAFVVFIALAGACTSFEAGPADAADASRKAAADASAAADAAVCALPAPPPETPRTCTGDCSIKMLFERQAADQTILFGQAIYIAAQQTVAVSPDVDNGTFTQLDQGPAVVGTPTKMAADDGYVYVSTDAEHVRVARAGGPKEKLALLDGDLSPITVGRTVVFQMQKAHVVRTPKTGLDGGVSKSVLGTTALAVDGDDAFWIGPNSANELVILGPFPDLTQHGTVTTPVGFVVHDRLAYVAEPTAGGASTTLSRIDLRDGKRTVIVNEPGRVEALALDDGALFWIARRLPSAGSRMLATVALCGGASTLLATDLPPLSPLAFSTLYVYATGRAPGAVFRMRRR